ncbi:MAG: GNAT family N-acetyltransferase [Flavobacteriaceae bacterium]|nr:GNAT family N-acetyltransferase [Flavobacteriaceae bacterium]
MFKIRQVCKKDNLNLSNVILDVLTEIGVPKKGTAYSDPELDFMFETYNKKRSIYYVVENNGKICGGAGIAPLNQADYDICELQKMYFLPSIRGIGLGNEMIEKCLDFALYNKFKYCYIETLPYMKAAQKLYLKKGFCYIDGPIGNTGHTSCNVWLIKKLK